MIALCVDDEALLLRALQRAVMKSPDISQAYAYDDAGDALDWARRHEFDIAFLDIRMPGMTGLELAEKLRSCQKDCGIVFCTGHTEYAISAINLHMDCGYLTKPVEPELVQQEIDHIKQMRQNARDEADRILSEKEIGQAARTAAGRVPLTPVPVRCYGGFEVYGRNHKPLEFKRNRAKELFALLIDRRGMGVSAKTVCSMMFEDDQEFDQKNMNHFYKLIGELKRVLDQAGYYRVIRKNGSSYYVETSRILIEDEEIGKQQDLPYMEGYSWRE